MAALLLFLSQLQNLPPKEVIWLLWIVSCIDNIPFEINSFIIAVKVSIHLEKLDNRYIHIYSDQIQLILPEK